MGKNSEPHFSMENAVPQLAGENLERIKMYNFEAFKNLSRKDNSQSLIDGITIRNRQTLNEVSNLILHSPKVKLYSSTKHKNEIESFCGKLLGMGIDASFYDISEAENSFTFSRDDLIVVSNFKSEGKSCEKVLKLAKSKYAKTASISDGSAASSCSDYNIICDADQKEKDENKMVESVLNCLSFTVFSKSMLKR